MAAGCSVRSPGDESRPRAGSPALAVALAARSFALCASAATMAALSLQELRMAAPKEARVPDIGGYDDVPVIEVLVAVGDSVQQDQGLVTLESDKATMEVPGAVRRRGPRTQGQARRHLVGRQRGGADRTGGCGWRYQAGGRQTRPGTGRAAARRTDSAADNRCGRNRNDGRTGRGRRAAGPDRAGVDREAGRWAHRQSGSRPTRCCRTRCRTPVPRCACSHANSASISRRSAGSERGGRISKEDVQKFVKSALAGGAVARWWSPVLVGLQPAAVAEGRLRQVRRDRNQAAVAHPEVVRRQPRAQLGDDPARHPARRCRHHRARSAAGRAQRGKRESHRQGRRRQADHAGVPDEGRRSRRCRNSRPSTRRSMPAARTWC